MRVQGGINVYGYSIGILVLDTRFPRMPGDIGNATTFDFPVRYHRVAGASSEGVVRQTQGDLLPLFLDGARALEREGVRAITTSCGFLARSQAALAAAVSIPVFTSSLMMVPMVRRMLPTDRTVGIMTVHAGGLGAAELEGAGVSPDMKVVVAGLETEKEFTNVLLEDRLVLDVDAARAEHVAVARRMLDTNPHIGAIVLECTNMPPFRAAVQAATGLPVFDITSLIRMVHDALRHGLGPMPA